MLVSLVPVQAGLLPVKLGTAVLVMCCWAVWLDLWELVRGGTLGRASLSSVVVAGVSSVVCYFRIFRSAGLAQSAICVLDCFGYYDGMQRADAELLAWKEGCVCCRLHPVVSLVFHGS